MRLSWAFNLITFTSGFTFFSFIFLVPLYAREELGLSLTATGFVVAASSIAVILFSPVWGALTDRFGRKREVLALGYALFALVSALHAFAESLPVLVLLRFLQGAAFATNPLLTALFADLFGKDAARRFGGFSAANALGWGLGSLISGVLADWVGIRGVFPLVAGLPLLSTTLLLLVVREPARAHPHTHPHPHAPGHLSASGSPAASPVASAPTALPKVPRKLFYLYATIFARHSAAVALWAMFPLYLRAFVESRGAIGAVNGINMIVQPLFMVILGRWAEGKDRRSMLRMVLWGILGTIVTFGVYATAQGIVQILVGQLMIALAWSAIFIGLNLYIMEAAPPGTRGRAFGYLQSSLTGAAALGPLLGGTLADALGIRGMIWVVAALMATSLPFLWKLMALDRRERPGPEAASPEPRTAAKEPAGCGCPGSGK